jgi:hypothetical protein
MRILATAGGILRIKKCFLSKAREQKKRRYPVIFAMRDGSLLPDRDFLRESNFGWHAEEFGVCFLTVVAITH